MAEVLKRTVTFKVGDKSFEFRVPSIYDEIKIGVRMRDIRRAAAGPVSDVSDVGIDPQTMYVTRAIATIELMLERTDARWLYSEGADKKPAVDSAMWPPENATDVMEIYDAFLGEVSTFRAGGAPDKRPPGGETVAGQQNN